MQPFERDILNFQKSQEESIYNNVNNSLPVEVNDIVKGIFTECLNKSNSTDEFLKSWSSDLKKRFPDGVWRRVGGSNVFINNGKVIAGLDGFNKHIDEFFEGKKKESDGKNESESPKDKLETKLKDILKEWKKYSDKNQQPPVELQQELTKVKKEIKLLENNQDSGEKKDISVAQKAQQDKALNRVFRFEDGDMSWKQRIDSEIIVDGKEVDGKFRLFEKDKSFREVPKTIYNYFKDKSPDKPEAKKEEGKDKPVNERSNQEIGEAKQKDNMKQVESKDKEDKGKLMNESLNNILKEVKYQLLPESETTYKNKTQVNDDSDKLAKKYETELNLKELKQKFPMFNFKQEYGSIEISSDNVKYSIPYDNIPRIMHGLQKPEPDKKVSGVDKRRKAMQNTVNSLISEVKKNGFDKVRKDLEKRLKNSNTKDNWSNSRDMAFKDMYVSVGEAISIMDSMENYIKNQRNI